MLFTDIEENIAFGDISKISDGCILISHRLASARLADMIYVLKDGVITEKGTQGEEQQL